MAQNSPLDAGSIKITNVESKAKSPAQQAKDAADKIYTMKHLQHPDQKAVENINIERPEILVTPAELKIEIPVTDKARETVSKGRKDIEDILERRDHRMFVVVGPCSIHDLKAAHEYARKLKELSDKVSDTLLIVMRVYFEKPRTTTGWKGLINDPLMNDSFQITDGLYIGRTLLKDILEIGLPTATEALDPISP